MIEIPVELDLNAHITDLTCNVTPENNCFEVCFSNLYYGVITAVKLIATGFNVFGDCVLVNGKEEFPVVIQDINVDKNARFEGYQFKLPDRNIRKVVLRESQICYDDGTITTYTESNIVKYTLNKYESDDLSDALRAARKDHYKIDFTYQPKLLDFGWVCGCGRFNALDQTECTACNLFKVNVLRLLNANYDDQLLDAYVKKVEKQDALKARRTEMKREEKKMKTIFTCIISVLLLAFVVLCTYMSNLYRKPTVDSVENKKVSVKVNTNSPSSSASGTSSGNSRKTTIRHYCDADGCTKEGTRTIIGWTGKTEYYCEQHYREMQDIVGSLVGPATSYSSRSYSSSSKTYGTNSASTGEKNALRSAQNYIYAMGFSYSGLIEQLEYEGYSHSEAKYGADNCGANWKEQAARVAKTYLSAMSFSRSGLIDQLQYEGFTYEQAVYGVEKNGY